MIKLKIYTCPDCDKELKFDLKSFQKNPKAPMPFICSSCKRAFGWSQGKEQEAQDYLKQALCLNMYKETEWCELCQATGNLSPFSDGFVLCKKCEGFGVIGEALKKEKAIELKEKEANKNKSKKGIKIDGRVPKEMRRLKASGLSVKNSEIVYKIPKEVREQGQKLFNKKKKAKKLAKKTRKRRG